MLRATAVGTQNKMNPRLPALTVYVVVCTDYCVHAFTQI